MSRFLQVKPNFYFDGLLWKPSVCIFSTQINQVTSKIDKRWDSNESIDMTIILLEINGKMLMKGLSEQF